MSVACRHKLIAEVQCGCVIQNKNHPIPRFEII
jgi:hypothetical protein